MKRLAHKLKNLGVSNYQTPNRSVLSIAQIRSTIRACVNTKGEKYLTDRTLFSILNIFKILELKEKSNNKRKTNILICKKFHRKFFLHKLNVYRDHRPSSSEYHCAKCGNSWKE